MESYRARILVVDDEESNLFAMQRILEQEAYQVVPLKNASSVLGLFRKQSFDLVLTDLRMPGVSGLELLRTLRKENDKIPVVVLTAYGTIDDAVEAMKLGAVDFLSKPLRREKILRVVQDALVKTSDSREKVMFLGNSSGIAQIKRTIRMLAQTSASVLIEGESGTGKEVVAKSIHQESGREGKLVTVNCGAIPENLLESELFGYERGAFTGAVASKQGLFEIAHKGTLFLDEIGELPLLLQVKLLRVLQDGSFFRLGGTEPKKVDVRIVAATNADLKKKISENLFREDLYYRLNVVSLQIPPLRDREEDILALAQYFFEQAKESYNKKEMQLSEDALAAIKLYSWPGNIRELRNLLERTVVVSDSNIVHAHHFGLTLPKESGDIKAASTASGSKIVLQFPVGTTLKEIELEAIRRALEYTGGDKLKAAEMLGINQRTIYRKMPEL